MLTLFTVDFKTKSENDLVEEIYLLMLLSLDIFMVELLLFIDVMNDPAAGIADVWV